MQLAQSEILVVGHRNPDTDASTSAVALAHLFNLSGAFSKTARAVVLGPLPPQAQYVFQRAGLQPPSILQDLWPRVKSVAVQNVQTVTPATTLREALEKLISSEVSMLPILDPQGRLESVFSHRSEAFKFLLGFSVAPLLGQLLSWPEICRLAGATRLTDYAVADSINGELIVALAGSRLQATSQDVLVCAGLQAWTELPAATRPLRVILIENSSGARVDPSTEASILAYPGDLHGFLLALQGQIALGSLALDASTARIGTNDRVSDVEGLVKKSRHAVPVVDENDLFFGVLAGADLRRSSQQQVVLVDHFDTSQAVAGIEHAEILAIIDHHRVGNLETPSPIEVDCRPVGSSCSIVAARYRERGYQPPRDMAILLLGGLAADTLGLRSPTTTPFDREIAQYLSAIAEEDFETLALDVLRAGDDLLQSRPSDIWERDRKEFTVLNRTFSVAQLETVSLASLSAEMLREFANLIVQHHRNSGEVCTLLFITDVLERTSWATYAEHESVRGAVTKAFGNHQNAFQWLILDGLVSRKKEVLPRLLSSLSTT